MLAWLVSPWWWLVVAVASALTAVGVRDVAQREHSVLDPGRRRLTEVHPVGARCRLDAMTTSRADVQLREVTRDDLAVFFDYHRDAEANRMAAFTSEVPGDRGAFDAQWDRILGDNAMVKRTVLYDGRVAGNVLSFEQFGEPSVGYWIGREHWGKGVATRALTAFLEVVTVRPLYARIAKDNVGSLRVLEKCGFTVAGEERGFAAARGTEIDELVLVLR